jgi:DNA-binding response OmpR family regulator
MTKFKDKKVLIVEDEELTSKAYGEYLAQAGYDVHYAYDGEEALEKIKDLKPDLVLIDILLPKSDGISVISQAKADPATSHIHFLILSNLSDGEKIADAIESGSRAYLVKSDHSLEDVLGKVKTILKQNV